MSTTSQSGSVRVGFYGTGGFANRTHIPNLRNIPGVEIVALCDVNKDALASTASRLPDARTYSDAHEMLDAERLDVLYSCVPAYIRTDVERTAAERGIHIFSEKPQALRMAVARSIDEAIQRSGVLSTVGFRERYRPILQETRRLLADKAVVHAEFISPRRLPPPKGHEQSWYAQMERSGGPALDWGVHAVDYARYMTGLNIESAQAFYCEREVYSLALSSSFNFRLSNGATMVMTFVSALGQEGERSIRGGFRIFYEGGYLELDLYDEIRVNGRPVFRGQDANPWLEHDCVFIEAVRTGDASHLLNDYHDGLYTLAPVLAGWESARRGGELIDVGRFMAE